MINTVNPYGRAGRPDPPDHGTRARYQSRVYPCTCGRCRAANADYQNRRRTIARTVADSRLFGEQLRIPGT